MMNLTKIRKILRENDFVHTSGTEEEKKVAEYLMEEAQSLGAKAWLEPFAVPMAKIRRAKLSADGKEVPAKGYFLSGSGSVEAELCYLSNTDCISLSDVRGKIVLLDSGAGHFLYQDLYENGAVGLLTYDGNVHYPDRDIDQKELRPYVSLGKKMLAMNMNAKDAFTLVKSGVKTVRIEIDQEEFDGESQNVIAEIPGKSDDWIILSAHYDTTSLSHGSYDNLSGCIGLLCVMETLLRKAPHRCGIRFIFCGSEERGLLGSKAYTEAHEEELKSAVLNINLDMIGTYMGRFIACVSAEEALVSYLRYLGAELGFAIAPRQGVYSSDSTPFADKCVPALSFARIAGANQATIHNRYDRIGLLSPERILSDSAFIAEFTRRMADSAKCPVSREIPETVRTQLDEYLNRKRRKE
ncbi:MAG: Zn-dependent exopeptidase M28 [Clostridia bacterium]|nr:Zn-dependent exopeptidase M28 [Clostridia bacterium]